jgi:hypothetical protein
MPLRLSLFCVLAAAGLLAASPVAAQQRVVPPSSEALRLSYAPIVQRVQPAVAVNAVQDLLARRAPADQYTRLRADVANDIGAGREPDQSIRSRTDAIIKSLPGRPPD